MPRKRLAGRFAVRWLLVVPFLLLGANFLLNRGVAFDDAWITYRYARNLSTGHGLVFNPGDANPTEGFTSILHVLISCVGLRAGIPPLAFTWLANLVLLAALPFVALAGLRRHWT